MSDVWTLEASEEEVGCTCELLKRCGNDSRWAQVVMEHPTLTSMYAPKQPCPRDLGYWYCDECVQAHLAEQSELNFPIQIRGCGEAFGSRVCGVTHLGLKWCNECKVAGRIEPYPHIGEHEVVARIAGGCEESQPMYSLYWCGGRPEIVLTE